MKIINYLFAISITMLTCNIKANPMSWQSWIQQVKSEAVAQGVNPQLVNYVFRHVSLRPSVTKLARTQPEHRITFNEYRKSRCDNYRIQLGKKEFKKNRYLLTQIGKQFSVDPCVIVAIWGLESSYGRFKGSFNVISSLATLAYRGKRTKFFRKELFLALHILNSGQVSFEEFKGEWAGASGHAQFLPSSWFQYAYDYNGDGLKDIWNSLPDSFASIANYLHSNGWQLNQPILDEVSVPPNFNQSLLGYKIKKPVYVWEQLGVRINHGQPTPNMNLTASLIHPDGGPYMFAFNNFRTLLTWNYSSYYVGTINYLANSICKAF